MVVFPPSFPLFFIVYLTLIFFFFEKEFVHPRAPLKCGCVITRCAPNKSKIHGALCVFIYYYLIFLKHHEQKCACESIVSGGVEEGSRDNKNNIRNG